jgi:UDP-N-acetyl-D-glucosamine dehydrogenase
MPPSNGVSAVGIVGLGYMGLPLAIEFAEAGLTVTGVDIDKARIERLANGVSDIEDVSSERLAMAIDAGRFIPTTRFASLADVQAISICVPTPLGKSRDPDVSYVTSAAESLFPIITRGQTVVLESTVYPGATEELIAPVLERSGMKAGEDFYLAFSPERIDPGNTKYAVRDIPKVVGGLNKASTDKAVAYYETVFPNVVAVGSTREAEMAKLLENTFRAVNIGLVNELAVIANGMGINIWNVIEAASTKPFGFMPFLPGPGLGGHCIPVDPSYLSWRARLEGFETGFIDQAGRVNSRMPGYVVDRVVRILNNERKSLNGSAILVLGVAYKRDVSDVRESPALDIMELLVKRQADLSFHDPHVDSIFVGERKYLSQALTEERLASADCVIIVTDHSSTDYEFVARNSRSVFDTRNATKDLMAAYPNIEVL